MALAWADHFRDSTIYPLFEGATAITQAQEMWEQAINLLLSTASLRLYRRRGLTSPDPPGSVFADWSWTRAHAEMQRLFEDPSAPALTQKVGRHFDHGIAAQLWPKASELIDLHWSNLDPQPAASTPMDATGAMPSKTLQPELLGELLQSLLSWEVRGDEDSNDSKWQLGQGNYRKQWGIHFTPRSLCSELVRKTLTPALRQARELSPDLSAFAAVRQKLRVCDPAVGAGAFLVDALNFLESTLTPMQLEAETLPQAQLRAELARHCLYGVDRDPWAVDITRIHLDLCIRQPGETYHPWYETIRCGDSLLNITIAEIKQGRLQRRSSLAEKPAKTHSPAPTTSRPDGFNEAESYVPSHPDLRRLQSRAALLVSEFFNPPSKTNKTGGANKSLDPWLRPTPPRGRPPKPAPCSEIRNRIARVQQQRRPFHWELEFPELCSTHPSREQRVVAIIGNPPFLGGRYITQQHGKRYNQWLGMRSQAQSTADLCAHFVVLAQALAQPRGVIGFLLSASITHDASRKTSLEALLAANFHLYDAHHEHTWLGEASVAISTFCASIGGSKTTQAPVRYNGETVPRLSARLEPARDWENNERSPAGFEERTAPGSHSQLHSSVSPSISQPSSAAAPQSLPTTTPREICKPTAELDAKLTPKLAYQGSNVRGEGFFLPPDLAQSWLEQEPTLAKWIKQFYDGRSLRSPPPHPSTRLVIDVGDLSLSDLQRLPRVFHWLADHVRPQRQQLRQAAAREQWWRFWNRRTGLYRQLAPLSRCVVTVLVSRHIAFAFADTPNRVFGHKLGVFALDQDWHLAVLQSRVHRAWAWYHSGQRGHHSLNYAPTQCFDNFIPPRPWFGDQDFEKNRALQDFAREFTHARQKVLLRHGIGLSQYYRRLNDVKRDDAWLQAQRQLHRELDAAVLAGYGFDTLTPPPYLCSEKELRSFDTEVLGALYELSRARTHNAPAI